MAAIYCPKCGGLTSTRAVYCPHCGKSDPGEYASAAWGVPTVAMAIGLLVVGCYTLLVTAYWDKWVDRFRFNNPNNVNPAPDALAVAVLIGVAIFVVISLSAGGILAVQARASEDGESAEMLVRTRTATPSQRAMKRPK